MLSPMNSSSQNSANPWIAMVQQLFSRDLPLENDYLRQENKILRSKLGARVPLSLCVKAGAEYFVSMGVRRRNHASRAGLGQPKGTQREMAETRQDASNCWNAFTELNALCFSHMGKRAGRRPQRHSGGSHFINIIDTSALRLKV
jgi:hypothetical protein